MSDSSPVFIKGTCMDMCPVKERNLREKEGLLHLLELSTGTPRRPAPKADPYLTVKSFSRSAAGQQTPCQDELRPPAVLYKTVCHLLTKLCTEPLSKFDPTVNHTHLLECLKRLLILYDGMQQGCHSTLNIGARAEMETLYLLLGLGDNQALSRALHLPDELRQHPTLKIAFAMSLALWCGNYVCVCTLLPHLPPLLMCVAAQKLPLVRRWALRVMSCAYSSRNLTFPLSGLQALLLYKTQEEAESDCRQYGILVKDNTVMFSKETFQSNAHGPCLNVECVDTALQSCDLPELLLHSHCVTKPQSRPIEMVK